MNCSSIIKSTLMLCLLMAAGAECSPVSVWSKRLPDRYFADLRTDIKIDGALAEWQLKDNVVTVDASTSLQQPPPVRSEQDSSAVVKLAWDEQHLYIGASVKDQSLKPLGKKEDMPWTCDSLIFVVSTFGATKSSDRYHQTRNVQTSPEPFFGFSYYTSATGPRKWTGKSTYVSRKTSDGYDIEASVSLPDIGYRPRSGDRVKMAYILADVNEWQAVPLRVSQRYRGLPEKGKPLHFTTLLYPHKPQMDVQEYVNRITVLKDTPQVTVFKVGLEEQRVMYLGINDTGDRINVSDVSTDARVFFFEGDPRAQPVKPVSLFARGVSDFSVGGKAIHTSGGKEDVDKSY